MITLTSHALGSPVLPDFLQFLADMSNAILHPAPVGFELRFTVASHPNATLLPGQVTPETGQAWQEMLQLRQFNLKLSLPRARALRKDVEDERRAIEHFALENHLEISALSGRKIIVKDDGIDVVLPAFVGELAGFASSDESRGYGRVEFLGAAANHFTASRGSEFFQFGERILEVPGAAGFELQTDEEHSLWRFAGCFDQGFQLLWQCGPS